MRVNSFRLYPSCLDNSQAPPEKLYFELTETAAIANLAIAKEFIARRKVRGCRFALGNFGSGLSSCGYLINLDVNFLKIDGMFVCDMVEGPIDRSMVRSINETGHVTGTKTIAGLVEDELIIKEREVPGVDYAQGYGIHKAEPLPSTGKPGSKQNDWILLQVLLAAAELRLQQVDQFFQVHAGRDVLDIREPDVFDLPQLLWQLFFNQGGADKYTLLAIFQANCHEL